MIKIVEGQMSLFGQDTWYGRTSQEPSAQTAGKISGSSSKKQRGSSSKMPIFLNMTESGRTAGASWVTGGPLPGVYMTHSFGECPSDAVDSRLSQILMEQVPQKYSLSAKACKGILTRAERRGKALPEILKTALERQAQE